MPTIPTPEFRALLAKQIRSTVYTSPRIKGDGPALTVKSVAAPGTPPAEAYYFSERVGRDSAAFLLYDGTRAKPYQALSQWHGPLARYVPGAFTGSFDKQALTPEQILIEEVKEEAGYVVESDNCLLLGVEPVSSQTNESVYLYLVDITGIPQDKTEPQNIFEEQIVRYWCDAATVLRELEWKAKLIVLAHQATLK